MADETQKDTVQPTDQEVAEQGDTATVSPAVDEKKTATIADVVKADEKVADTPKESVPLAVYLEEKKERKALEKSVADLQKKVAQGATSAEISDDIATIGEKYGVKPEFLSDLTSAITSRVKGEAKKETDALLQPLRAKELDEALNQHIQNALEELPEFKDIANVSVIKALAKDPANAKKTFSQLLEDTYGKAISGKRTVETTTPNGGKEPEPIDYVKASKDNNYLTEILKDPAKKAEYNKNLHKRMKF